LNLFIVLHSDSLDLTFLNDLQETEHGLAIRNSNLSCLNCTTWALPLNRTIAKGWSKSVYWLTPSTVIKRPNIDGQTFQNCFHANFGKEDWNVRCRLGLLRGFLNEIRMLLQLQNNPNVIKMISYCIPPNPLRNLEQVSIVTEKGDPLDTLALLQLTSSQRERILHSLLLFFNGTRTLRLHDFRRQQIVTVDGHPKIVDFDEAYFVGKDADFKNYYANIRRKLISELLVNYTDTGLTTSING
ncbi:hypothetical protein OESDEN_20371, partial [Oesophagostomum dentatum]